MRPATSPSDAELIARARAGDDGAYSELRARHVAAARRLVGRAGRFGPRGDDVVDEAFAVVLDALRRGAGPDIDFRTYLFSVLRRGAARPAEGTVPLGRVAVEPPPPGPGLARAYEALPERWRAVLWYTDVEGTPPSAVEAHLGLSSTEVAALAYRAREALRQSYVAIRIDAEPSDDCRRARERIEAHAVGALTSGEDVRVQHHLDTCTACAALAAELVDLRGSLARAVGPRYLGAAAGSYLARVPVAEPPVPITEPVARDRRRPVGPVRVGAAALIVLVAALVTLMVYAASGASVSEETAASEGEAAADLGRADPDHGPRAADADTTVGVGDGPTSPPADGATATQRDTAPSTAPAATSDNRDAPDPPSSTGSPGA
ncbi:MAG: RNA polymerase sigma factor [Acidimicrobiales bacterium]